MLVPESYKNLGIQEYFENVIVYLRRYKWLWHFQLTKFFTERIWEKLPPDVSTLSKITSYSSYMYSLKIYKVYKDTCIRCRFMNCTRIGVTFDGF